MADRPVKCSSCDVPAQVILEENIPQKVVCPRCGMSESYEEFQRSVGHQASAYASKELGKAFRDMARGNKNIRYKPGNIRSLYETGSDDRRPRAQGDGARGQGHNCGQLKALLPNPPDQHPDGRNAGGRPGLDFGPSLDGSIYRQYRGRREYYSPQVPITGIEKYREMVNRDVQTILDHAREVMRGEESGYNAAK